MEAFLVLVAVGLALVVAGALGVVWWEQRRHDSATPHEPAPATGHAAASLRSAAASAALSAAATGSRRPGTGAPAASAVPATARIATLRDEILTGAGWAETQPMIGQGASPSFAETMPFDLEVELPDFGAAARGHARGRQPA